MTSTAIFEDLELLIHIDRSAEQSLRSQLIEQLGQAILKGQLAPERRLPSTRMLACLLGISRNVVVVAYDELFADGYILRQPGSGTYVNSYLPLLPRPARPTRADVPRWLRPNSVSTTGSASPHQHAIFFQLGASDISPLPLGIWRSIWKEVSSHLPPANCWQTAGDLELRIAIADYLRRSRGIDCESYDVLITTSATQAIDLIARAILILGDRVAFEEPGYIFARQMLLARGASIVPIPVDFDGLQVDAIPVGSSAPLLVYITPSHQFPLGGRMPIERRIALLEWGAAHDSLIQEVGKRGVIISALDPFYLGMPNRNGLLLGYGGLALNEISQGATILAEVIAYVASKVC